MASEVRAVRLTSSPSKGHSDAGSLPSVTVGGITYQLPFEDLLPALGDDDLKALRDDIRDRGIVVPIIVDEHHNVIDGANRLRIAAELGIRNLPVDIRPGLSHPEKEELAEDLNPHRRHLSREQLRDAIARRLKRTPEQSDRQIAAAVGVDHHTVASIRRGLQATGEFPQLPKTIGRDGQIRSPPRLAPARRITPLPAPRNLVTGLRA